jgi:lipopolysaccharide export system ATP-binding protein
VSEALLRAEALVKSYGGRRVVDGVSFEVRPGEVVGLLGPNGAGKTTSFNMTVGLVVPDGGRVFLGEHDLTRLPMHRRARLGLGYLPQEASIFRKLTVRQNFIGILEAQGVPRRERNARADDLIAEYRLEKVAGSLGEQLSGGERRRAEVARSLLRERGAPHYILFDEPFAGVDPIAVGELQRLIGGLRDRGIGVLLTDHNVREALGICTRAYILVSGSILEAGTPTQIAGSARAREVYLGEKFRLDEVASPEQRTELR